MQPSNSVSASRRQLGMAIGLTLLAGLLLTAGVWFMQQQNIQNLEREKATIAKERDDLAVKAAGTLPKPGPELSGKIRGTLTYPSEGIPKDMTVCALHLTDATSYCTGTQIADAGFKTGVGYEVKVKPGKYAVFSYLATSGQGALQLALHDTYIRESIVKGSAPDACATPAVADPVIVDVTEGSIASDIVVGNWYFPSGFINCK